MQKGGDTLSLEDIKSITEAEKTAAAITEKAVNDAKALLSDAERRGRSYAEQARTKAEAEVQRILTEADRTAAERIAQARILSQKRCETMASAAAAKLDEAAAKIVERIVNS